MTTITKFGGVTTDTWAGSGSLSASGDAEASQTAFWDSETTYDTNKKHGYYDSHSDWEGEGEDHYSYTGSWTKDRQADGTESYAGTIDSHQWGSGSNAMSGQTDWHIEIEEHGGDVEIDEGTSSTGWSDTDAYDEQNESNVAGFSDYDSGFNVFFINILYEDAGISSVLDWRPNNISGAGFQSITPGSWTEPGSGSSSGGSGGSSSGSGGGYVPGSYSATATPVPWDGEPLAVAPETPDEEDRAVDPWVPPDISYQAAATPPASGGGSGSGGSTSSGSGNSGGGWGQTILNWLGLGQTTLAGDQFAGDRTRLMNEIAEQAGANGFAPAGTEAAQRLDGILDQAGQNQAIAANLLGDDNVLDVTPSDKDMVDFLNTFSTVPIVGDAIGAAADTYSLFVSPFVPGSQITAQDRVWAGASLATSLLTIGPTPNLSATKAMAKNADDVGKEIKTVRHSAVNMAEDSRRVSGMIFESRRMSNKLLQQFEKQLNQLGVTLARNADDYLDAIRKSIRARFDANTATVYLRRGATRLHAFHEYQHVLQWVRAGRDAATMMNRGRYQLELEVFREVWRNRSMFNKAEIQQSIDYIRDLKRKFGMGLIT